MPNIPLTKNYKEAAEGMLRLVKNGTRHEHQEGGVNVIEVIGEWKAPDPDEGKLWGGRLKFVFRDHEAKRETDLADRHSLAEAFPQLAAYVTSKTLLTVYKQDERSGNWRNVTRDFAIRANKYGF